MPLGEQVPDKKLLTDIQRRLAKKCSSSPRVSVDVSSGEATVSGTIKLENERKPVLKCISGVQGVRRVIDRMKIEVRKKYDE